MLTEPVGLQGLMQPGRQRTRLMVQTFQERGNIGDGCGALSRRLTEQRTCPP